MASCSEQFLKVSWNSVQRTKRSSGLEMGTDGRKNERANGQTYGSLYTPANICGGYNNSVPKHHDSGFISFV